MKVVVVIVIGFTITESLAEIHQMVALGTEVSATVSVTKCSTLICANACSFPKTSGYRMRQIFIYPTKLEQWSGPASLCSCDFPSGLI